MKNKNIVISGINLFSGGPLSVLKDCLNSLKDNEISSNIIVLVHKKELFKEYEDSKNILFLEFPLSRKSWIFRLYYEYIYFYFFSKKIDVDLWISLHDISPNVNAKERVVYCHNPSPFYKMTRLEKKLDSNLRLFNLFYKFLYKINIKKNTYVIVQQNWIRQKFEEMYKIDNLIVAYPDISLKNVKYNIKNKMNKNKIIFFYPAFPRVFKNFEIICEVAKELENKKIENVEFILTLESKMNRYSDYIYKKYKDLKLIKFVGKLTREEVFTYYEYSDAMIFPSKLETWGLPITEFKKFKKPIFLADLKYAYETIGEYDKVIYFNPFNKLDLLEKIEKYLNKKSCFLKTEKIKNSSSVYQGWNELLEILLKRIDK